MLSHSQPRAGTRPLPRLPGTDLFKTKKRPLRRRCKFNQFKTIRYKAIRKTPLGPLQSRSGTQGTAWPGNLMATPGQKATLCSFFTTTGWPRRGTDGRSQGGAHGARMEHCLARGAAKSGCPWVAAALGRCLLPLAACRAMKNHHHHHLHHSVSIQEEIRQRRE